jgi:hypothetical protein
MGTGLTTVLSTMTAVISPLFSMIVTFGSAVGVEIITYSVWYSVSTTHAEGY